jgi:membrane-associated protein
LNWFDAHAIIAAFGDWAAIAVAFVIFIETAFIFTSILPGDSLLFLTGLALANSESWLPDWAGFLLIWTMAFSGTQVGYWIGAKIGPPLIAKERKFILNKATLSRTHEFFENYGARAVVLARFVPILRALIPMLAGISKMDYRRFTKLNLIGATAWVVVFMVPGYWLGGFEMVKENLEVTVLCIVAGTTMLLPLEILRDRLVKRHKARKIQSRK